METDRSTQGLGIIGWDLFEYVVADLERSRRFFLDKMGVPVAGRLQERASAATGEDALLLRAGSIAMVCVSPRERGSRAARWLKHHPEGVSTLAFRVKDLDQARRLLVERGGTLCTLPTTAEDWAGRAVRFFEIATPLGEVRFRFTERSPDASPPGFDPVEVPPGSNPFHFQVIDHVTSNFLTIEPWVTWLRDVMGFQEYWRVQFHTSDMKGDQSGSGLSSIVMWDPESGIKLANNEPYCPNFEASQIYSFIDGNSGPGVQHVAFHVPHIERVVEGMRGRDIQFLDTPGTYYDMLPARLEKKRVTNFTEDLDELRRLGILVDGADDKYLLQIFSAEGRVLLDDERGGPFFYEIIQRRGARGFGEGNFRALFEAIERDQEQRTGATAPRNAWAGT